MEFYPFFLQRDVGSVASKEFHALMTNDNINILRN